MSHIQEKTEGPANRADALTATTSQYHARLLNILRSSGDRIAHDISFRLLEFENRVALGLELSNYLTDDVFVKYTQIICRIVSTGFSKTACVSLMKAVTDMTTGLHDDYQTFLASVEACRDDSSARYGSNTDIILNVQDLWESQLEQAGELSELLEKRMTQTSDVANGLLWSILETLASGDRQLVRTTALQCLNNFLRADELAFKREVDDHFQSMVSLVDETFKDVNTAEEN